RSAQKQRGEEAVLLRTGLVQVVDSYRRLLGSRVEIGAQCRPRKPGKGLNGKGALGGSASPKRNRWLSEAKPASQDGNPAHDPYGFLQTSFPLHGLRSRYYGA